MKLRRTNGLLSIGRTLRLSSCHPLLGWWVALGLESSRVITARVDSEPTVACGYTVALRVRRSSILSHYCSSLRHQRLWSGEIQKKSRLGLGFGRWSRFRCPLATSLCENAVDNHLMYRAREITDARRPRRCGNTIILFTTSEINRSMPKLHILAEAVTPEPTTNPNETECGACIVNLWMKHRTLAFILILKAWCTVASWAWSRPSRAA